MQVGRPWRTRYVTKTENYSLPGNKFVTVYKIHPFILSNSVLLIRLLILSKLITIQYI